MKLIRTTMLLLFAMTALYSCKKEDASEETLPATAVTSPGITTYSNMAVGNYWIYQLFNVDSLDNFTATTLYDSCYVEKDTLITTNMYHKLVKFSPTGFPASGVSFLRDSADCIVDAGGIILFSSTDFTSTFNHNYQVIPAAFPSPTHTVDTVCEYSAQMINETNVTGIPAGAFVVLNYKTTYLMHAPYNTGGFRRYRNAKYCKNIGLISETIPFFVSTHMYRERRLVRYGKI